jgi:hypothetical protein
MKYSRKLLPFNDIYFLLNLSIQNVISFLIVYVFKGDKKERKKKKKEKKYKLGKTNFHKNQY